MYIRKILTITLIYRLAISVKDGANIIIPNLELQGKVTWNNQTITKAAPWKFCDDLKANYSSELNRVKY